MSDADEAKKAAEAARRAAAEAAEAARKAQEYARQAELSRIKAFEQRAKDDKKSDTRTGGTGPKRDNDD